MNSISKYFSDMFSGISSLWAGMRVTGKYFVSPGAIVTQQYPENRATLKMEDRFKGEIIMPHDENNLHACTGCGICEINCPTVPSKLLPIVCPMPMVKLNGLSTNTFITCRCVLFADCV